MHTGGRRLEAQEGGVRARVRTVAKALVIEPIAGRYGAVHGVDHLDERFEAGFGLVAILSEGEAARYRSLLRPGELWVQTDAAPTIWAAGCHFSTQLARPHAAGGGKQVLRPPPLKIASTAEHVRRVVTRAREGHGGRKVHLCVVRTPHVQKRSEISAKDFLTPVSEM